MRQRFVMLVSVAAVITVAALAAVSVAGQIQTGQVQITGDAPVTVAGPAPKTSWGVPDLSGIWDTTPFQIPLQRPAKYKDQQFFTDAERAELDKLRATLNDFGSVRSVRGTEVDLAGAYNSVYLTRRPSGGRTSLITDPPDGRIPPVTPEVTKRRNDIRAFQLALLEASDTCKNKWPGCEGGKYTGVASPRRSEQLPYYPFYQINRMDHIEDHGFMGTRCMGGDLPGFGGFRQIVQSPDAVSIFYDVGQGQGFHRVIPFTSAPHLPANVRTWWGDSRGRWEGNTLVVDVTNFNGKRDFQGSTDGLHMIERWTRTGPTTLEYVATLDDPKAWTKPWTVKQEYVLMSNERNRIYKEPRCMEGNFALIGMLAGARAQEKAFAEGRGPDPATVNYAADTRSALTISQQAGDEDPDPLN